MCARSPAHGRQARAEARGRVARIRKREDGRWRRKTGPARIRIERVILLYGDVVVVRDKEEPQRPNDRLERSLAFEKVDADREIVREENLLASAEKFRAIRSRRAHTARCRKPSRLELEKIVERQVQENVLADNGRVAFELALQIRMPEAQRAGLIGRFR